MQIYANLKGDEQVDEAKELNPFSAGIDFRRQNQTSTDVRFWRLKSIPTL